MKSLSPVQQTLIHKALSNYAQKQERILEQYSFDSDVDSQLKESQLILEQIKNLSPEFVNPIGSIYILTEKKKFEIEQAIRMTEYAEEFQTNHSMFTKSLINVIQYIKSSLIQS